jgi:hypothetical protein
LRIELRQKIKEHREILNLKSQNPSRRRKRLNGRLYLLKARRFPLSLNLKLNLTHSFVKYATLTLKLLKLLVVIKAKHTHSKVKVIRKRKRGEKKENLLEPCSKKQKYYMLNSIQRTDSPLTEVSSMLVK